MKRGHSYRYKNSEIGIRNNKTASNKRNIYFPKWIAKQMKKDGVNSVVFQEKEGLFYLFFLQDTTGYKVTYEHENNVAKIYSAPLTEVVASFFNTGEQFFVCVCEKTIAGHGIVLKEVKLIKTEQELSFDDNNSMTDDEVKKEFLQRNLLNKEMCINFLKKLHYKVMEPSITYKEV